MSLDYYLRACPNAGENEIREFISGHLCRCTGYVPIMAAATEAAQKLREGREPGHA
jgi:2-furoyl-CoA dehydrogenase 2Fe-2S iron sulfur subunit